MGIYDEDQLIGVIAVQHVDVHPRPGHPSGKQSELARDILFEPLDDNLAFVEYANSGILQRSPCGRGIVKQEVGDAVAPNDKSSATFHADAGPT